MELYSSFAIITLAALVHACFQLSLSLLTLLSGHAIGRKTAHKRLIRMTTSYTLGVGIMTLLLLSAAAYVITTLWPYGVSLLAWAAVCGALIGLGIAVWLFYYRQTKGTGLWLPEGMAKFLNSRTKNTRSSAEAFTLGLGSVVAELLFIGGPLLVSALVIAELTPVSQLLAVLLYGVVATTPLLLVWALVGSGHKISRIQRWREDNRKFLQYSAATGLVVLACYLYVAEVIAIAVAPGSGY